MATNIQDEDVEEIPSRYLHTTQNRNRNRNRKNNAAARTRARARARRRRRRRRNRNRRNRNRLFTNKSYVKEPNDLFVTNKNYVKESNDLFVTNRNYVRESTQQQQSSTEQLDVTENLGGCSGAEGSICAIFYPQAPPNENDNAGTGTGTANDIDYDDYDDEINRSGGGAVDPTEDPTELPTAPTFVSPHTWRTFSVLDTQCLSNSI
jgi:hypothetical protein